MAKRKHTKAKTKRKQTHKKKSQNLKLLNLILAILIVTLIATILSYFFLLDNKQTPKTQNKKITKDLDLNTYTNDKLNKYFMDDSNKIKFEEYTKELDKEYVHKDEEKLNKKDIPTQKLEPLIKKEEKTTIEKPVFDKNSKKAKLVIVIDDVTNKYQIKKILNIGYKVNISLLPPTKGHLDSANIAKNLPFYIIHFPLQAQSFKFEEENTLHVGDSYTKIENRVKLLRKLYPNAKYTNNHTGSKFTSDEQSMDYLYKALKKYNFVFVDSRTTAKTVAKKYAKKYNMPYITRNVFIDNKKEFSYIQNQLKKAIKIAKKNGHAIAIGHPYNITLRVLKESKPLLKDLELIYLKDLPYLKP